MVKNGYVHLAYLKNYQGKLVCLISNDCLETGIDYNKACTNEFAESDVVRIHEIANKSTLKIVKLVI